MSGMEELEPGQRLQADALDEEYNRRYGVAVELIKNEVGPGVTYANAAARAVVSRNGAWLECVDLPMEFTGAAGAPVHQQLVSDAEAMALLDRLFAFARSEEAGRSEVSLFVLYGRSGLVDGRQVYIYHRAAGETAAPSRPREIGRYQPEALPMVYRCRLHASDPPEGLTFSHGVVFCLAQGREKNLVVEMSYEGDEVHDLSATQVNPMAQ
jgi:hypothetical protein